jgi:MFS family permease
MLTQNEKKTTFSLASIYAFRMLGLFMILPVFSLYIDHFKGATPALMGLALGVYGLTQGVLQIPFGLCSDRIGRKPVIIFGLILFIIGSIVAAQAHNIHVLIWGRAIQGAGAIGSTLTALLADNTQEENRLKAMSILGMTIGLSFILALIIGPILNAWVGLPGIFWVTALLALIGIMVLIGFVPTPSRLFIQRDNEAVLSQFKTILLTPELLRLDFGIFCLHAILTALFVAVPLLMVDHLSLAPNHQWMIYLPVLLISFALMLPFIIVAEKKRLMKPIFVGAILVLTIAEILLGVFHHSLIVMSLILILFFAAFTFLESSLPSLVAKIAPAGYKGTAMGIYSSAQFLGILAGGATSGWIFGHYGLGSIFILCAGLGGLWFIVAVTMQKPRHLSSKVIALKPGSNPAVLEAQLRETPGVFDVMVCPDAQVAYLKIDKAIFNQDYNLESALVKAKPTKPMHSEPIA